MSDRANMSDYEQLWSEETTGLCPQCLRTVAATVFSARDGFLGATSGSSDSERVWIEQKCPRHGVSRALLASDAAEYRRLRQYTPERVGACCCGPGETCGPQGKPPVCVLLLEITQACNLRCPTCYADAHGHDFMTLDEARSRLDSFFRQQSTLDVLMLSGGEPTIHPRFPEMLALALEYPIGRVLINTNGLRVAQDPATVQVLAGCRSRVEIFLSFSSFRPLVHERLYGRDLIREKTAALDRAEEAGLYVTLVPVVENGINDDEVGALFRYALTRQNVNGLNFQPVMDTGRYLNDYGPHERATLTSVLRSLEEQTSGAVRSSDFIGLPCSHPDCCAITYGLLDRDRTKIEPLPRHLDIARYLDLFSDRISFAGLLGGAARRVWSDMAHLRAGRTLRDLAILFSRGGLRDLVPLIGDTDAMGRRLLRIVVKPFMDAHTYDHRRIDQCCTMILTEGGRPVSFCEYNVFHRGRKPRAGLKPLTMAQS